MNTNNTDNTKVTKDEEVKKDTKVTKINGFRKYFGGVGMSVHANMEMLHDNVKNHPVLGTIAYGTVAAGAITFAPVAGIFYRKQYEEYTLAEAASDKTVDFDFDLGMNKPFEVNHETDSHYHKRVPDSKSLMWTGVAATAVLAASVFAWMSHIPERD